MNSYWLNVMALFHIYYFAHYNLKGPCVRYRGKYFLEALKEQYGIRYSFVVPGYRPLNILHFIHTYFSVLLFRKSGSLIVFQKIYTRGIYANALKVLLYFRKRSTIYDLDDAYYLKFPASTMHHFMRHVSMVLVGSLELEIYARQFNRQVFQNTSPVIWHQCIKEGRNGRFTIGWIGFYNAHRENMEKLFFPVLSHLDFHIRLVILGVTKTEHRTFLRHFFSSLKHVELVIPHKIEWLDEISVYQRIAQFDIGISPLLETEMNRAKSAFKLKQYLSSGVPVLASPVGENRRFIQDGYNGFLCNSPLDFHDRIEQIYRMPQDEYRLLCQHARMSVGQFSMDKYCKTFLELIDQAN